MLDTDARVAAVNDRVARLRRKRERRANAVLSTACAALCFGLFGVVGLLSGQSSSVSVAGLYGSSSLLGSNAGGYVLVAVISFSLAVVVTMLCLRRRLASRGKPSGEQDATAQADEREGDGR